MTLYPAFRCTLTVRIFLAMYWLVPCISPLPKSEASCAPALVEMLMLLPNEPPMLAATSDVYKRQPLYGARYHSSLLLLLTGSCPSRARKSVSGILLTASISVLSMPVSVDDELDTDPELRVKLPRVATPKATLPQIGKQGYTVCHVAFHIERQRAAVDEGVPVVQRRTRCV